MDFSTAISGALGMVQIADAALKARDNAKASQAIADIQLKLVELSMSALAVTEKNISLVNEVRSLQDELNELKIKASDRDDYILGEVCMGVQAYKPKKFETGRDNPFHYLCQPCFDKGIKSMLRYRPYFDRDDPHENYVEWQCLEDSKHSFRQNS